MIYLITSCKQFKFSTLKAYIKTPYLVNALLPLSLGSPKVLDSPKERFDMTAVAPTVAQAQNQNDLSRLAHIPYWYQVSIL